MKRITRNQKVLSTIFKPFRCHWRCGISCFLDLSEKSSVRTRWRTEWISKDRTWSSNYKCMRGCRPCATFVKPGFQLTWRTRPTQESNRTQDTQATQKSKNARL